MNGAALARRRSRSLKMRMAASSTPSSRRMVHSGQAVQDSDLQLTGSGEIRRYEWKEQSPGQAKSLVIPNDQFLTQTWSASPQDKPQENLSAFRRDQHSG